MTVAEKIAKSGVGALDSVSRERVKNCEKLVETQASALAECEGAVRKLDAGESLTKRDRLTLVQVVGLNAGDIDEIHKAKPNPDRLEKFFMNPHAFFFVKSKDGSFLKVFVEHGKPVKLIPDSSEDF